MIEEQNGFIKVMEMEGMIEEYRNRYIFIIIIIIVTIIIKDTFLF